MASTWGYDQMIVKNFCVVKESRLYPIQKSIQMSNQEKQIQEYKFEIKQENCKCVRVAGTFNNWQPILEMKK